VRPRRLWVAEGLITEGGAFTGYAPADFSTPLLAQADRRLAIPTLPATALTGEITETSCCSTWRAHAATSSVDGAKGVLLGPLRLARLFQSSTPLMHLPIQTVSSPFSYLRRGLRSQCRQAGGLGAARRARARHPIIVRWCRGRSRRSSSSARGCERMQGYWFVPPDAAAYGPRRCSNPMRPSPHPHPERKRPPRSAARPPLNTDSVSAQRRLAQHWRNERVRPVRREHKKKKKRKKKIKEKKKEKGKKKKKR